MIAASIMLLVFISGQSKAGPSVYNMDRLLAQPYPFVTDRFQSISSPDLEVMPGSGQSVYNMDRLLAQPYPFAVEESPSVLSPNFEAAPAENIDIRPDLTGVGSESEDLSLAINDPLESVNRAMFDFNEFLRDYLLGPIAQGYNDAVPEVAREAIENFFDNLGAPVTLANDLLQGEFNRGIITATRTVINSTAGIVGFIDVAEKFGLDGHKEDFGQTMGVWGVGEGFYLILPLLGPSNPRDAFGQIFVDSFFDPLGYYLDENDLNEVGYGISTLGGVSTYAKVVDHLQRLRETSIDFYGTLRSLYLQRRKSEILNLIKDWNKHPISDSLTTNSNGLKP